VTFPHCVGVVPESWFEEKSLERKWKKERKEKKER